MAFDKAGMNLPQSQLIIYECILYVKHELGNKLVFNCSQFFTFNKLSHVLSGKKDISILH